MDEKLLIVGINHRTAPVAVRERLAYGDGEIVATLGRLTRFASVLVAYDDSDLILLICDAVA